jgi:hypothetical protein
MGCSLALGVLSKQYTLLYAAPLLMYLAVPLLVCCQKTCWRSLGMIVLWCFVLGIAVNAPNLMRKLEVTHNIRTALSPATFYPGQMNTFGIETPKLTLSTFVRFAGYDFSVPVAGIRAFVEKVVEFFHTHVLGMTTADPINTEYTVTAYKLSYVPTVGALNMVVMIVIALILWLFSHKSYGIVTIFSIVSLAAVILLCMVSKYHNELPRYAIPFFAMACAPACMIIIDRLPRSFSVAVLGGILAYGVLMIPVVVRVGLPWGTLHDPSSPYYTSRIFSWPRMEFLTFQDIYRPDYEQIATEIKQSGFRKIAIANWCSGNEPLLWSILYSRLGRDIVITDGRPLSVNMENTFHVFWTKAMRADYPQPDCVVLLCPPYEVHRWPVTPGFHMVSTSPWHTLYLKTP